MEVEQQQFISSSSSSTAPALEEKVAVHFGAGNIGRGFIGPLLSSSGYHVTFIDVQKQVVEALNNLDSYPVRILDASPNSSPNNSQTSLPSSASDDDLAEGEMLTIENFSALQPSDPLTPQKIAQAAILTTSVGPPILSKIASTIAQGITLRRTQSASPAPLTIIACENMVGGTSELQKHVLKHLSDPLDLAYTNDPSNLGWANCAIDRIVPPYTGEHPLEVGVEGFFEWVVERNSLQPPSLASSINGLRAEEHLAPFLERKLYTLNCGHAIAAYLGHLAGHKTILSAISYTSSYTLTYTATMLSDGPRSALAVDGDVHGADVFYSKADGKCDSVMGSAKNAVGGIMNDKEMQAEGTAQHKSGETQTKVAEFVGTAQGAYDQAAGKVNNLIGSFTGDSTQQAQGKLQETKGDAQKVANS